MHKSRLSHYKQARLIEHFVSGSTSLTAARLCGVNPKTASISLVGCARLSRRSEKPRAKPCSAARIEVDESDFGGRRQGRRGRGAAGKIPVFGLLKRGGKITTRIIPDASSATLMPSARSCPTASSIRTVGEGTTCLMCQPSNTCGSTIWSDSQVSKSTSTTSNIFGARQSVTCVSATVSRRPNSGTIWRNANGVWTTGIRWFNYPKSNNGLNDTWDS